ncbi:MAG: hypothetical protein ACRCUQ_02935 [Alphaproteobacteria bacterium]
MFKFKFYFLNACFSLALLASEVVQAHPPDLDRDRGGAKVMRCTLGVVERAGVAIVKDYGPASRQDLRYGVIVGGEIQPQAGKNAPLVNFFVGNCEQKDEHPRHTAVEELYEETGKAVNIDKKKLYTNSADYFGYVYGGSAQTINNFVQSNLQLFFYRDNAVSVMDIAKKIQQAKNNKKLSHRFKENETAYVIPLQDILDRVRDIHNGKRLREYTFKTRGKGDGTGRKKVRLNSYYMEEFLRDMKRNPNNFPTIARQISNGNVR